MDMVVGVSRGVSYSHVLSNSIKMATGWSAEEKKALLGVWDATDHPQPVQWSSQK